MGITFAFCMFQLWCSTSRERFEFLDMQRMRISAVSMIVECKINTPYVIRGMRRSMRHRMRCSWKPSYVT